MVQPWNLGPPAADYTALGSIGETFNTALEQSRKRALDEQKRNLLATAAQGGDLSKAGLALIGSGDVTGGAALLQLGQKNTDRDFDRNLFGGAPGATNASPQPPGPVVGLGAIGQNNVPVSPPGVQVANNEAETQRLEAESNGASLAGNPNAPRGLRNNNPGNIESGKFAATAQGFQGSDGRFAQYETPEQGIQAADKLLTSYAGRGLNTVASIVNRWAPPSENNTGAYAASVARELGVDPNQPLDMNNWKVRQRLIAAKIRVENGRQPYSEDVFQRALNPNWQTEVAAAGDGASPAQVAQAPQAPQDQQPQVGAGGVYAGVPAEVLTGYLNNPKVPDSYKALMQQELASRQGGQAPVQVAQAAPPAGSPVADVPAQGAQPAQFVIPGATPQQAQSIASDPNVQKWSAIAAQARTEQGRAYAKSQFDLAVKDAEQRVVEGRSPETVKEFLFAKRNGMTQANSPAEYAREKAAAPSSIQEYEYEKKVNGFKGSLLDFQKAQAEGKSQRQTTSDKVEENTAAADKLGLQGDDRKFFVANGRLPTAGEKVTEGQANAALYADRMRAADAILNKPEAIAAAQSRFQQAAGAHPSIGSLVNSDQYKLYDQAKLDFITAKLRRESGAAISASEFEKDDKTFFPQPGDPPALIAQKAEARKRVIEGIGNAAGPSYAKRQAGQQSEDAGGWQDLGGGIRIRQKQ